MEIDGFNYIMNTIYIAKKLEEAGRKDLIDTCLNGQLHIDFYYEDMLNLIYSVFPDTRNYYKDDCDDELMIISDPALADYFVKSEQYGIRNGIPAKDNPYLKSIQAEAERLFNFSYSMDWKLNWRGLDMPGRTRLAIWISPYDFNEHDHLTYSLLAFQSWLVKNHAILTNLPEVIAA